MYSTELKEAHDALLDSEVLVVSGVGFKRMGIVFFSGGDWVLEEGAGFQ